MAASVAGSNSASQGPSLAGRKNTYSLSLVDSAITGNVAGSGGFRSVGFGGGIALDAIGNEDAQTLTASNTTIAGNIAGGDGEDAEGSGGGIYVRRRRNRQH